MPQRNHSKKQTKVTKKNKRITLPVTLDAYNELRQDAAAFRQWLDGMIEFYPELFPAEIAKGYTLHDVLPASVKLPDVQLRRIRLAQSAANGPAQVLTIAPSNVLPYMVGLTDQEAQRCQADYVPQTVNTDGWRATRKAWSTLFSSIVIIDCFLHAFLKIRDRSVTSRRWRNAPSLAMG